MLKSLGCKDISNDGTHTASRVAIKVTFNRDCPSFESGPSNILVYCGGDTIRKIFWIFPDNFGNKFGNGK